MSDSTTLNLDIPVWGGPTEERENHPNAQTDYLSKLGKGAPETRERVRAREVPPMLPPGFTIDQSSGGIRFRIVGSDARGSGGFLSGSVRYDIHWVEVCDMSTFDGINAAFARSIIIGSLAEPGTEGMTSETTITEGRYQTGYFFITGVNAFNDRSEPTYPRYISNGTLDARVPPNVENFAVSESGEVVNGTVFSALSISGFAPNPLEGFAKLQLVIENYPTRGQITEWLSFAYDGLAGGPLGLPKVFLQAAVRVGKSSVTTNGTAIVTFGAGENALLQAAPGDVLEILGVRATILSIDTATQITLTAPWPGETVVALTDYRFLGKVRIYARSVSSGGGYDDDLGNLPFVDVILDAELSSPNAPSLTVAAGGNVIRAAVTIQPGTQIERAILYRGTGTARTFADCTPLKTWTSDQVSASATLTHEDTQFTTYEREQGQRFSYFATVVNSRGMESLPSTRQEANCRLDAPADGAPTVPMVGTDNLIWNGHIGGTNAGNVNTGDAAQDTAMGMAKPTGYNRWASSSSGGATLPSHANVVEVKMPPPGLGNETAITQSVGAWSAAAGSQRIPMGKRLILQLKGRTEGGTPNGSLRMSVRMYNAGLPIADYKVRIRDAASDSILTTATEQVIPGAAMTSDPQVYYGWLEPDAAFTTCDAILVKISHKDSTAGTIYIREAMLHISDSGALSAWNPIVSLALYPAPGAGAPPPGNIGDRDGGRRDIIPGS